MRSAIPKLEDDCIVTVVLLAAGEASRMGVGGRHKLLAEFDGIPLVRRSAVAALGTRASSVTVVTGHRHQEIKAALGGLDLQYVHNPDYASGMAGSLVAGFRTDQVQRADGALVLNADMPKITSADLNALIVAFERAKRDAVIRAATTSRRGNPVVLPRSLYDGVLRLRGDVGARHLIEISGRPVVDVPIEECSLLDVDTPEAILAAGGVLTV
ncbi:nucleotidyltransferase family protein [Rhizobium leguminosarum]|uniref:nucleotidyltransferase family protein n=1 Tax=Rhizobium leguminosarum TaxID=384 RepID=UPI001FED9ECB|nr:nucleotidyltransferase family protein [Rhizobium leguminosarum]